MCDYPLNYKYWEYQLGRRLRKKEIELIKNARFEIKMNMVIDKINDYPNIKLILDEFAVDHSNGVNVFLCLSNAYYFVVF